MTATPGRTTVRWNNKVPGKDEQRSIKRQTLLDSAARLFNERGYNHTTLDDVAASLGVSKPTLYYYVKNKEDILFECSREALSRMQDAVHSVADSQRTGRERLEDLFSHYFDLLFTEFGKCLVVNSFHTLSPASRKSLRHERRQVDHAVKNIISQGISDGSVAVCDPKMTTFALFGTFNWICHWYKESGANNPNEIKAAYMGFVMNGLVPR